jgi:hypothetical protein
MNFCFVCGSSTGPGLSSGFLAPILQNTCDAPVIYDGNVPVSLVSRDRVTIVPVAFVGFRGNTSIKVTVFEGLKLALLENWMQYST